MSDKPKIFFCGNFAGSCGELLRRLREQFEVHQFEGDLAAAELPAEPEIVGVFCSPSAFSGGASEDEAALRRILEDLPDGVVLVDENNTIRWRNQRFKQLCGAEAVVGQNFFGAMGETEILGPDFCPFHTSLATGQPSMSRLRVAEKSYYQLYVSPFRNPHKGDEQLIVVVRDITVEVDQQQKLQAIHQAGIELTDLQPDAVCDMTVEERIELLKSNILHHTKDLLNFDVVEIRLLEQSSGRLVPLLAVGMAENAASRALFAKPHDNGVTGFVASTGRSYLCEDTQDDPLYLPGLEDARSSITVPLMLHEEVIGTFNVESPEPRAFTENDQLFVEIYSRDVAVALNTLELLAVQSANVVQKSVEAIHGAVALPIDQILNDTVHVIENYIGHDTEIAERLRSILRSARDIKGLIQEVGKDMTLGDAVPASAQMTSHQRLQGVRILVVDADEAVLHDAHEILERQGAIVETARTGGQAVFMVRHSVAESPYRVVISDVRLPDMTGHKLLLHLKQCLDHVPLVLMQAFGYDPGHSIVKARQAGLHPRGVLYKPFRVDQLLDVIETILEDSP